MRKNRQPGIRLYLLTATAGVLLVSFAAFTLVSLNAVRRTAWRQSAHNLHQVGTAVAHLLEGELRRQEGNEADEAWLQEFAERFGAEPEFRLTIINREGRVLADSNADPRLLENHARRPEVAQALAGKPGSAVRYSASIQKPMVYHALPWHNLIIRLSITLEYVQTASRHMTVAVVLSASAILLAAMAGALLAGRRFVVPLTMLERAAAGWSEGAANPKNSFKELAEASWPREFGSLAAVYSDLSDRLAERIRRLDDSGRETEAIVQAINDALIVLDSECRVLRVNPAAERVFGIDGAAAAGQDLANLIDNTSISEFAIHSLGMGTLPPGDERTELTVELASDKPSKGSRWLLAKSAPVGGAGTDGPALLLVFSDITRLTRLERIRKDFVANVSHELKTPITSIKGFIETLKDGAIDDSVAARRFLEIMDQQSQRLSAIIEDLLTISRLEQDEQREVPREKSDILLLLRSVEQLCAEPARERGIQLSFIHPSSLSFRVNSGLIEQALVNLVKNAITYCPEGSLVLIEAEIKTKNGKKPRLVLTVTDNGPGIPARYQERIFERFYRLDKGRSRDTGGTGLGLSIVRHIALAHGGKVNLKSREGQGCRFRISIPDER